MNEIHVPHARSTRTTESAGAARKRRPPWLAGALLAVAALLAACDPSGTASSRTVPADWPRLELAGVKLPTCVAWRMADRERLVPPQVDPFRPLTRFFASYSEPVGLLFTYPDARYRSVHFDHDQLSGRLAVLFLDAEGRVETVHRIGSREQLARSDRPIRAALFTPGAWFDEHPVATGTRIALPKTALAGAEPETARLERIEPITVGGKRLEVEIAHRTAERNRGLMYRDFIPDHTGMLFLFPAARPQKFWMRNTRVGLDAAYIDENRVIKNIVTMRPHDLDRDGKYASNGPVVWVLETRAGWFRDNGVRAGDRLVISEALNALRRRADP